MYVCLVIIKEKSNIIETIKKTVSWQFYITTLHEKTNINSATRQVFFIDFENIV